MQNTHVKLEMKKYPKMIESFAHENFNLKTLSGGLAFLLLLNTFTTIYLLKKGPEVIALEASGHVAKLDTKITDLQIQEALKEYISYRYSWNKDNAQEHLKRAEFFVEPNLIVAFRKAMVEVTKYIQDKKVTQRVYPKSIEIDLKNRTASITLDRITEFEQLKAATEMKLILNFSVDDRTPINPWGIYITKETEKVSE
jgi:hypothetical protein